MLIYEEKNKFLIDFFLTMVNKPEAKHETRSFPARAHTIVLCAPLTAGP